MIRSRDITMPQKGSKCYMEKEHDGSVTMSVTYKVLLKNDLATLCSPTHLAG